MGKSKLECPNCYKELGEIGCEKTIICPNCGKEWKYKYGDFGDQSLIEVEKDDLIYLDR